MSEIRESWEGEEGVTVKRVNVKSFHYFDKVRQINRKIFSLAIDDLTGQICLNYIKINYYELDQNLFKQALSVGLQPDR